MLFDHVSEQNIVPYLVATPLYTHTQYNALKFNAPQIFD